MSDSLTLTSLAMLKVDLDNQHRNYVDYMVPFVVDILNVAAPQIISDAVVTDLVLTRFGLKVPVRAIQHVLRRLQKKGFLAPRDGVFIVTDKLPKSSLSETRGIAKNHIDNVIEALMLAAIEHGRKWTKEDATSAITSFLGKFTVECLRTYVFRTALPAMPAKVSSDIYIVSKFLKDAQDSGSEAFGSFIVLVKGLMYSNALLCPDLESLEKKFQDITFYIDTPLVLNLLGLQGLDAKRSADELISLILKLKGSLAVFSHTVAESQHVLSVAASNINNPKASGKVIEEARRAGFKVSDLVLARDSLDERLRSMRVYMKRTPDYAMDYQIDENLFESVLAEEVYYKGESALLNDVNSVRSIYALRKGRQPVRLEDAGAVLVTTNHGFARAAYIAGRHHNSTREVSSVITAYSLANIAWLKSPLEAPTLPLHETMALCYAALEPSRELFKKYVEEMDSLLERGQISVRDHEILRLSPSAKEELMELTLGDEDALTHTSIQSILENAKRAILAEQQQVHDEVVSEIKKQGVERVSEVEARESALMLKLREMEQAASEAKGNASRLNKNAEQSNAKRKRRARRVAEGIAKFSCFSMLAILLIGAMASSGLISVDNKTRDIVRYGFYTLIFFVVVWGIYSWYNGRTVKQVTKSFEDFIAEHVYRWLQAEDEA